MSASSPKPAIITCAVVGGVVNGNPHQPQTRREVVDASIEAARAGAAIVHIHGRTNDGEMTGSAEVFESIRDEIRSVVPDVLLNFTTGGALGMSFEERCESLRAGPTMASLNAGTFNIGPDSFIYENPRWFQDKLAAEMAERGILPEYECFELGMVVTAVEHAKAAAVPGPVHMVLGVIGGAPATIEMICQFTSMLPPGTEWWATAVGRHNIPIMAVTLARGGHIRTGLEDVAFLGPERHAPTNGELVERAVGLCDLIERPVASPQQAREILGIAA